VTAFSAEICPQSWETTLADSVSLQAFKALA